MNRYKSLIDFRISYYNYLDKRLFDVEKHKLIQSYNKVLDCTQTIKSDFFLNGLSIRLIIEELSQSMKFNKEGMFESEDESMGRTDGYILRNRLYDGVLEYKRKPNSIDDVLLERGFLSDYIAFYNLYSLNERLIKLHSANDRYNVDNQLTVSDLYRSAEIVQFPILNHKIGAKKPYYFNPRNVTGFGSPIPIYKNNAGGYHLIDEEGPVLFESKTDVDGYFFSVFEENSFFDLCVSGEMNTNSICLFFEKIYMQWALMEHKSVTKESDSFFKTMTMFVEWIHYLRVFWKDAEGVSYNMTGTFVPLMESIVLDAYVVPFMRKLNDLPEDEKRILEQNIETYLLNVFGVFEYDWIFDLNDFKFECDLSFYNVTTVENDYVAMDMDYLRKDMFNEIVKSEFKNNDVLGEFYYPEIYD